MVVRGGATMCAAVGMVAAAVRDGNHNCVHALRYFLLAVNRKYTAGVNCLWQLHCVHFGTFYEAFAIIVETMVGFHVDVMDVVWTKSA